MYVRMCIGLVHVLSFFPKGLCVYKRSTTSPCDTEGFLYVSNTDLYQRVSGPSPCPGIHSSHPVMALKNSEGNNLGLGFGGGREGGM